MIIGHRGASALEPENSLQAFERARTDGADGVELDVLRCATGEVVVFHDDDLTRLGGRRERIADLSLTELRSIQLISGARIPTLAEVFEACGDSLLVNVELKASGISGAQIRALVAGVAVEIKRAGRRLSDRVLVSSFHPRAIYAWHRQEPNVRAGLLFERDSAWPLRKAWALPLVSS
ncbi:MAG: glycerophosphodiester phosphodiesterase, partial [Deltaproteobacteria bacterium]|nr:glycerophosphodiester phosphodiesterase [Deltaproteobacteria bacterium]